MAHEKQTVLQKAMEYATVRDELLDTLEEHPSAERDHRVEVLTTRKDQLLKAVVKL